MEECYRVLKKTKDTNTPAGEMTLIWPNLRSNAAFADPTNRRFIPQETLLFFNREWREAHAKHLKADCNFAFECQNIIAAELGLLHPEVQTRRFNAEWNAIINYQARMLAVE